MAEGNEKKAPTASVPGWHEDPHKEAAERLWDGSKWTSETRGELPKVEKKEPSQEVPTGWYPDPKKEAAERLWDGSEWTPETRGELPKQEPSTAPEASRSSTAGTSHKGGGKIRGWIRSRPILWVSLAALVALVIGIAAGGDTSEQDDQIAQQNDQIAQQDDEIDDLQGQLDNAQAAEDKLASRAADLKDQKKAIQGQRKDVEKRENQVSEAEQIQKQNTITDGIWKVGSDFDAGTYRSDNGDCYWAKLSSAGGDFDSIIANGNGPNQTVTIDSPWFESSGCGEWQKVG